MRTEVHTHGTEEGRGLACRERWQGDRLVGECIADIARRSAAAQGVYSIDGMYEADEPEPTLRESRIGAGIVLLTALLSAWVYVHAAMWVIERVGR